MRVLHLFNIFGALTERAMLEYTLALARGGCEMTAAYETLAPEAPPVPFRLVQTQRIPVEPTTGIDDQMTRIGQEVNDSGISNLLREHFDVVHGHFGPRLLQAAPWLLRGTPVVISTYGYDVGRLLRDPSWIARYRWAAGRGATFVALARFMEDGLLSLGLPRERVRRIHLGIDLGAHAFDPRPAPPRPRFAFIGRFVDKKGADTLIDAMSHVIRVLHTPATLDLIGAGPNESGLREQIARLAIAEQVRFFGTVPFARLFDHLRDCTALVQPSQTAPDGDAEGAPMVLMSAQAAGIPCITTRHSGNPETIPPPGHAFIVPERDPVQLATAMQRMIHLPAAQRRELQHAGREWIERHFNLAATVAGYASLYEQLIPLSPRYSGGRGSG